MGIKLGNFIKDTHNVFTKEEAEMIYLSAGYVDLINKLKEEKHWRLKIMRDKERLIEVKGARKRILAEESFQKKCIFLYSFDELGYLDWLIEQAEKVEQLQRENEKEQKRLQSQIYETVEEKFLLEKQLQQAKAQAERYKQALEFYASRNHYLVYYDKLILLDDGEIARKALEESK